MPELPDLTVYQDALQSRIVGQPLQGIRLASPFLLRSVTPSPKDVQGLAVTGLRRLGKRLVVELAESHFLVIHLMIAGRLRWREPGAKVPGRVGLAAFDFPAGTLILTEAGTKRRASLHIVAGEADLAAHDPGGLEALTADTAAFAAALRRENHTVKRALTDPHLFAGIGNAYSDEILHRAGMSPFKQTGQFTDEEAAHLHRATVQTLHDWVERLRAETGDGWPEKVTAFREDMAVHGRFGKPCPVCEAPVQRIVRGENEANYCPRCQTGGRILADRALSRLLRDDWPRTLDELERIRPKAGA